MGARWRGALVLVVALGLGLALSAGAQPLSRDAVPEPLAPWVDWVLRGAEEQQCPFAHGDPERRQCAWPARLSLDLGAGGGRFRQEWRSEHATWVPLPGGADSWPVDVRSSGAPAPVVARGGVPSVRLPRGRHVLTGAFRWSKLPQLLRIPVETGLVSLALGGRRVAFPERDLQGRLWLQKRSQEAEGESRLDVVVHRRVIDEVPLQLDTVVELKVSGQSREVLLGPALPEGFVAMALRSSLPARLESDGRLRVQVRPGTWRLQLLARHAGAAPAAIGLAGADGPWDPEEVWVFEARGDLRLVHVEGVPGIDPQQTLLPDAWKQLPAYLMKPGSRMQLVEKRRGDADPAPDRLALSRTWWLDFDGGGYTVHDEIRGALSRSWRLETLPPMDLGRVAIEGRDQFISRLDGEGGPGVEVRQGRVDLDADSRLEGVRARMSAVGWNHDFQQVSGRLNLPPGWRLFHASGVDEVRTTWTTRWSLLEIFLVLITALIVARLWGWGWGALAFAALALGYPEPEAPRWSWLGVLAAQALLRVVPRGRLHLAAQLFRVAAVGMLVVVAVPFAVQQARLALYPALEFPYLAVHGEAAKAAGAVPVVVGGAEPLREESADLVDALRSAEERPSAPRRRYYAPDPQALVSTGPGLPHWGWRAVELSWRGPVQREQEIRLFLVPPWGSSLLAWLRVVLTALLALCVLDVSRRVGSLRIGRSAAAALLLPALGVALAPPDASADIPSPELLAELRERLTAKPECFPECASSPRLRLEVSPDRLRARIEFEVASATAVPLPGKVGEWLPTAVLLDGQPAGALAAGADGQLWMRLEPGRHQVSLDGALPPREALQIPLPLRPHRVEAQVSGWTLDGVREDGTPASSLRLTRDRGADGAPSRVLEPSELPPFVRVERTIQLGLSWQVETSVVRVTPPGSALFLEVPLLPGESVTSETVRVEDGRALVNLAADSGRLRWTSLLDQRDRIALRAPDPVPWTELWRLDVSPLWHVSTGGIPVVHRTDEPAIRTRTWRPWPGEEVTLAILRPAGVDGRTLTIDRSRLRVSPGLRASDATLTLSLRASRGVQHALQLPEGAALQSVEIDGQLQPVRDVEGRVVLPIRPGKHAAELVWRAPEGIAYLYSTPSPDLGTPSVNTEIELEVPGDRWVLLVGGPRMGPAVLFWSLLVVAGLVALGLGQLPLTPLRWASWLLLFVGLTQVPVWVALVVVGWLLALGWRRQNAARASDAAFDALQLLLAGWTVLALLGLFFAIRQGLLGTPDMQIAGNGSDGGLLRWYRDRSGVTLPTAWAFSVPLLFYRLAMLAWALWLAGALLRWLRWGWQCFSQDGLWRPLRRRPQVEVPGS
jgi:hypothetical protein